MQSFRICGLLLSFAVAIGTDASAAPAKKQAVAGGRDKAVTECVALAKSQASGPQIAMGSAADPSDPAVTRYKDCMRQKGYRP